MVDRVKGGGHAPGWADFTIMTECTPESDHCQYTVCILWDPTLFVFSEVRESLSSWAAVHSTQHTQYRVQSYSRATVLIDILVRLVEEHVLYCDGS